MQKFFKILKLMMDIVGAIKNFFGWGEAATKKATQREALNNSPTMQKGAVNAQEQAIEDKITNNVAERNLDEMRKDGAE